MIDLALEILSTGEHDLVFKNFDLSTVDEIDAVRQSLAIRLQFFFGEWFLDITKGVKLFEFVFVKSPDADLIATVMKATILDTQDVLSLLSYKQDIDPRTRKLTVDFIVNTTFGELDTTQTIGP